MTAPSLSMNVDTGEKTWLTPPSILRALGVFDLDPCCPDGGMPWPTAARMITKSEDSLSRDWGGASRVFLNPPYGRESEPFFRRMAAHPGGGIALVFARTDTRLWQEYVFPVADSILFLRGRLRFCNQRGEPLEPAPAPSALVAYSPADTEALRASGLKGCLAAARH